LISHWRKESQKKIQDTMDIWHLKREYRDAKGWKQQSYYLQ
jgi:hypothetical protein